MGKFKKFHEENSITEQDFSSVLMVLAFLSENSELNESELTEASLMAGISDMFGKLETGVDKIGMKLHKGKGLIDYAKAFTGNAGKLIIAAIKKDKDAIREITNTFEKAEFMDFLLKLDMVTMHLITGPIHMVDAITGWDLMANLKQHAKKAENIIDSISKAISDLKVKLKTVMDAPASDKINSFLDSIGEMLFGKVELEESLNEGLFSWLKNTYRDIKYNAGEYSKDYMPYFIPMSQAKDQIPKNVYVLETYDIRKDIVKLKSLRDNNDLIFTMKQWRDEDEYEKFLDIGNSKIETSTGWFRIQLMEKIIESGATITIRKNGAVKTTGKYSSVSKLNKQSDFKVEKGNQNSNFLNDFIKCKDSDNEDVEVYFYDVIKFK